MKQIFLLLIVFLSACSQSEVKNELNNDFTFLNEMKFNEFKLKVKKYANQSPYPNIEN